MSTQLDVEIKRLEALRSIDDHVCPEEIERLRTLTTIATTRLRMDALRLILRTP